MAKKLRRQIRTDIKVLKRGEQSEDPCKMLRGERTILLLLATIAQEDGTGIYCGVDWLVSETGYSRRWVQKCLRNLEQKGYIVAVSLVGGRGRHTMYHIPLNDFGVVAPKPPPKDEEAFLDDQARPALPARAPVVDGLAAANADQAPDLKIDTEMEERISAYNETIAEIEIAMRAKPPNSPGYRLLQRSFVAQQQQLEELLVRQRGGTYEHIGP